MRRWTETLAAAGLEVASADPGRIVLRHADASQSFLLRQKSRSPRLSELVPAPSPDALLIAPRLSASVESRLLDLGWSWVTDAGQLHLQFADHAVEAQTPVPEIRNPASPRLSARGVGTFAVLRRLLVGRPGRQTDLASSTGLSQPRVSQILAALTTDSLVRRERGRWRVADWDEALSLWVARYPGPGGVTTYWAGLDDPWSQALAALDALPASSVVSGDLGADLLAPWRQPQRATIYAPALHDLTRTGLVQVGSPTEATLLVCIPADPSVWPAEAIARTSHGRKINVADPIQVLWDIRADHDADSAQAADRLILWLRQQYASEVGDG